MDRIKTTPAQLRAEGAKIQTNGEEIASKVEQMISIVNDIGAATWSGEAASAYKAQFSELSDDAARMKELLINTNEQLNSIATQYEQAEESNASLAHSLPADIF